MSEGIGLEQCPECGSDKFYTDYVRSETVCKCCGIVIDDYIPDSGYRSLKFDQSEHTVNEFRGRKDLGSFIGSMEKGQTASSSTNWAKARTIQKHEVNKGQRAHNTASIRLQKLCGITDVPKSVENRALEIYDSASKKKLTHGIKLEVLLAAGIYEGYREVGSAVRLETLAKEFGLDPTEVKREWNTLRKSFKWNIGAIGAEGYVPTMARKLEFDQITTAKATRMAELAYRHKNLVGAAPQSVAAGCALIVDRQCNLGHTQQQVAEATGVSGPTLKKISTLIGQALDIASC